MVAHSLVGEGSSVLVTAPWNAHDFRLYVEASGRFKAGELHVGDRAFCSFTAFAILAEAGSDGIFRGRDWCRKRHKGDVTLGPGDRLTKWEKRWSKRSMTVRPERRAGFPDEITVRVITAKIHVRGFRDEEIVVVTSLLDDSKYPKEKILDPFAFSSDPRQQGESCGGRGKSDAPLFFSESHPRRLRRGAFFYIMYTPRRFHMAEEKEEVLETQSADGAEIRDTDIVFDCPHCSKTLVIDYRGAGLQISCSECGKDVLVPIPDGMELTDLDMDPGEILKQLFATRRNYQKAETRVQGLKARLVSLQETLAVMQQVIAEGLADE